MKGRGREGERAFENFKVILSLYLTHDRLLSSTLSRCGVHLFRAPCHTRDCIEVNMNCVDGGTADALRVEYYDGNGVEAMGAGIPMNTEEGKAKTSEAAEGCGSSSSCGAASCGENPGSTKALTTALATRRIDPYVYSSPPSALMAFDAFEKQINQHHIRTNRKGGTGSDPNPIPAITAARNAVAGSTSSVAQVGGRESGLVRAKKPAQMTLKLAPSPKKKNGIPMDTPMKNQLSYYLSRHLEAELGAEENWRPMENR